MALQTANSAAPVASPSKGESTVRREVPSETHGFDRLKTIFIILDSGTAIRNIIRTNVFAVLRNTKNLRIVIFSPITDDDFKKEVEGPNIIVEPLQRWTPGPVVKTLRSFRKDIWGEKFDLVRFREKRIMRKGRIGRTIALKLFLRDRSKESIDLALEKIERWEKKLTPHLAGEYFDKYKPDLLFYTSLYSKEHGLEIGAEQRGVKSVTFILSWDNPTTKGPFPVKPDAAILWNNVMRQELLDFHNFKPEQLFVSGPPQFDIYTEREKYQTREQFFARHKLDSNKKLITYATGTVGLLPLEHEIIEMLYDKMRAGAFKQPVQLVVRLHPKDVYDVYKRFEGKPDIFIQLPGRRGNTNDYWNPTREDMYGLAETMLYSDVVVNIASTITIDASAVDTPVVNFAFDGFEKKPYEKSYARFYNFNHYRQIVKTNGLKISNDIDEGVRHIQEYLDDPTLDAEGRARIREEQCFKLDGKSGERIARYLIQLMHEAPAK